MAWPPTHAGGVPAAGYGGQQPGAAGRVAGETGQVPEASRLAEGAAQGTPQEYGTQGYGGQPYPSQTYAGPDYSSRVYSSQGYSSRGDAAAAFSQGHGAAPGQGGSQDYGPQGRAARAYGAPEYGDQAYGLPGHRAQEYGAQPYGLPEYRAQEYRAQEYGARDYGPQGYPAQQYLPPVNAPYGERPAQGYADPGYPAPGYAPPGYPVQGPPPGLAGQDYGPPGPAGEPAAPGAAAAAGPAGPAAYPAPPPSAPATTAVSVPAAPAAAEESVEPLYGVLGGLALRDLTLVESLLELVEQLESREEDPQQLDSLFRADHLATRMRRNSENLLVLAGQDRESQDFDPVPLLDVARAAVSEIADYDRAQVAAVPGVQVLGVAADDVTHILAELLDNAMSKSPQSAEVVIRAERTGDGTLVISVEDSGIGIPVDRLSEINARLSRIPVVDVAVTRHMGLYVVGRLAHRHGIRVQLRERPYGGIAASVIIPADLVRNDPDAPREILPAGTAGRYPPLGGMAPSAPQLSIEARGADGLRAQREDVDYPTAPFPSVRGVEARQPGADPGAEGPGAEPGARSGTGWPVSAGPPVSEGQETTRTRPAPAPAAGYRDAVPVPRFEPADPAGLPKRKPGALSAANGIPAPPARREKVPAPAGEDPALESEAERIRDELSDFQSGQRAAWHDVSGPDDLTGGSQVAADTETDAGQPAGSAPDDTGENDEA
jgi:hypothetical protein